MLFAMDAEVALSELRQEAPRRQARGLYGWSRGFARAAEARGEEEAPSREEVGRASAASIAEVDAENRRPPVEERVFVPCQQRGHDIVAHELTADLASGRCRRCDCPEFLAREAPRAKKGSAEKLSGLRRGCLRLEQSREVVTDAVHEW